MYFSLVDLKVHAFKHGKSQDSSLDPIKELHSRCHSASDSALDFPHCLLIRAKVNYAASYYKYWLGHKLALKGANKISKDLEAGDYSGADLRNFLKQIQLYGFDKEVQTWLGEDSK